MIPGLWRFCRPLASCYQLLARLFTNYPITQIPNSPANCIPNSANHSILVDGTSFILYYCIINSSKEI